MKQPENNEIDSLLRGLASRERSVGGSAESAAGVHLDADELSSYAEGVLPVATRARYTSHLADCDDCREIVTHLSLAAGPLMNDTPVAAAAARFDWRKMLAALFAPAVLRYAMPAIVLIAGGFAFFMWQQQRKESMVALNQSSQAEAPRVAQSGADANKELTAQRQLEGGQTRAGAPSTPQAQGGAAKSGAAASDEKAQKTADAAKPDATPTGRENEGAKNEDAVASGTYAPEPAPPPAVAKPTSASETKDSSQPAGALAEMKPSAPRKKESDKQSGKQIDGVDAKEAPGDEPAAAKDDDRKKAKALNGARSSTARRDPGRDEEESETRSIGGRRFQRHNNIWVDTAFNSSLSITTLRRGSETYRALVADEPGIDVIAKQLSGEIFLVWKGRAYRIL